MYKKGQDRPFEGPRSDTQLFYFQCVNYYILYNLYEEAYLDTLQQPVGNSQNLALKSFSSL